ncbi:hypothetical protein NQ317_014778 [Molorchus minor]|uniref:FAD-binding FR-type domain-containing protein n=1 Tax=Molorchus minor TaxID=1323400 RepID=A0ABQ9IY91_9CUCU|nr:hypothetical protein NQ317_014778 [Molorchus minor]
MLGLRYAGRFTMLPNTFRSIQGGPEELMKGAGIDATRFFDQIHPWVNYEQILQKCYIGRLVAIDPKIDAESLLFGDKNTSPKSTTNSTQSLKLPERFTPLKVDSPKTSSNEEIKPKSSIAKEEPSPSTPPVKEPEIHYLDNYPELPKIDSTSNSQSEESEEPAEDTSHLPRFDWIQRLDWITVIFYTHAFANPQVEVFPPSEKNLMIILTYDNTIFRNELTFLESVKWPCTIQMSYETGKVEGGIWNDYGVVRQSFKTAGDVSGAKYSNVLTDKVQINHNMFLMRLERTDGCKVVIPIGKHVRIFGNVDGQEMSRSYTPVPQTLFTDLKKRDTVTDCLCLAIKRYENGNVSRFLTDREKSDLVQVTKPMGDFELRRMEKRDIFLLLAAGSGITPILTIVVFLLERRIKICQFARLLFFNRTENDIPFREELEGLERCYKRLKVDHILSQPGEHWKGLTGHVHKEMIENAIQEHIKNTGYTIEHIFTFICGPNPFVALSLDIVNKIGMTEEQIHAFQG